MIFIAKNEDEIPSWKLAQNGIKTVTRRMKPLPVGKEFAIQPGRGKYAVCRARVIACDNSMDHFHNNTGSSIEYKRKEAHFEGFYSWGGLMQWFQKHNINFADTYRIEFKIL
jgi:hypothetical protein